MTAESPQSPAAPARAWFATPGPFTDLGAHAVQVRALPHELTDLCRVVQGLVIHPYLAHLYGLAPAAIRLDEVETRQVAAMIDRRRGRRGPSSIPR